MKIKQTDYDKLKSACQDVISRYPGAKQVYKEKGLSDVRYAWDVFRMTGLKIGDGKGVKGDIDLYEYLNDNHITTALLQVTKEQTA